MERALLSVRECQLACVADSTCSGIVWDQATGHCNFLIGPSCNVEDEFGPTVGLGLSFVQTRQCFIGGGHCRDLYAANATLNATLLMRTHDTDVQDCHDACLLDRRCAAFDLDTSSTVLACGLYAVGPMTAPLRTLRDVCGKRSSNYNRADAMPNPFYWLDRSPQGSTLDHQGLNPTSYERAAGINYIPTKLEREACVIEYERATAAKANVTCYEFTDEPDRVRTVRNIVRMNRTADNNTCYTRKHSFAGAFTARSCLRTLHTKPPTGCTRNASDVFCGGAYGVERKKLADTPSPEV